MYPYDVENGYKIRPVVYLPSNVQLEYSDSPTDVNTPHRIIDN